MEEYTLSVRSITYAMKIQTEKKRNELIDFNKNYSVFESDIVPTVDDHLLTLSTCSGFGSEAFNSRFSSRVSAP